MTAEQFIKDYTNHCSNEFADGGLHEWLTPEQALRAVELGRNNLWKPADGDYLPEIDREVVVFIQNFPEDAGIMKVAIAHRPNPNGWDGRSILTGEVDHYTPKTYDKGGWNIPDVKWWLDLDLPKPKWRNEYDTKRNYNQRRDV